MSLGTPAGSDSIGHFMRGAILMSLLAVTAALSMHYVLQAMQETQRSDPIIPLSETFQPRSYVIPDDETLELVGEPVVLPE